MSVIRRALKDPVLYAIFAFGRLLPDTIPADRLYLRVMFRNRMHRPLDLENPQTYNEKLQWLKLYDRQPVYTVMADKYAVKQFVSEKIGPEYVVPTLGVWDSAEEIDFDALPDRFVLKCTHDSGGVVVCRDKSRLDTQQTREKIARGLKRNYYLSGREWPYKNVKPRVLAEEYIGTDESLPVDYKFFCFNGKADNALVCLGRGAGEPVFVHMNRQWERLDYQKRELPVERIEKPACFEEMWAMAERLSEGIPHVRVDLYCQAGRIYFGEFTFFDKKGFDTDITCETDRKWGQRIDLQAQRDMRFSMN